MSSSLIAFGVACYVAMLVFDFRRAALMYLVLFPILPITLSIDLGPSLPLLTLSRWLLLPLALAFYLRLAAGSVRMGPVPFRGPLVLFGISLLASNVFSVYPNSAGWFRLLSFVFEELTVFLIAVSVLRDRRDLEWLLGALVMGVLASVTLAAYELASGRNLMLEMAAGGREFLVYDYSLDLRFGFQRIQSLFRNPLDYGTYLAILLPFVLVYFRRSGSWTSKVTGLAALVGGLLAAGLTWSRTPVYALIVMAAVVLVLTRRWGLIGASIACVLIAIVIVVDVLRFPLWDYMILSAATPEQITEVSGSSLDSFWRITSSHLGLVWQHPVFGRGAGALPPNPGGAALDSYLVGFGEQGLTYLLVETGLLGAGTFAWLFWCFARRLYGGWQAAGSELGRELNLACLCMLAGYILCLELAGVWHFSLVLVLIALTLRSTDLSTMASPGEFDAKFADG